MSHHVSVCVFEALGIEPTTLYVYGKYSTMKLYSQTFKDIYLLRHDLTKLYGLVLNSL